MVRVALFLLTWALLGCDQDCRSGAAGIVLEVTREAALEIDQVEASLFHEGQVILSGRRPESPRSLGPLVHLQLRVEKICDNAHASVQVVGLLGGEPQATGTAEVDLVPDTWQEVSVHLSAIAPDAHTDAPCTPVCGTCAEASPDTDDDSIVDCFDNCMLDANPDQRDTDGDGVGNRCDTDVDMDGDTDADDSVAVAECSFTAGVWGCSDEPCQCVNLDGVVVPECPCHYDINGDGLLNFATDAILAEHRAGLLPGPAGCDPDNDCVLGCADNCMLHANPDQRDTNDNGMGNRCDADVDMDGDQDAVDSMAISNCFGTTCTDSPCECVAKTASCSCHHDLNGDGVINAADSAFVRAKEGFLPGPGRCAKPP